MADRRSPSPAPDAWNKVDEKDRFRDLSDYARPLALRVVALLRETRVRSVHVTWVFLAVGLVAGGLIASGGRGEWALAALLLQAKNLLDAVDGSLARAQGRPSRVGRFLDSIADFLVNVAVYAGLALAVAPRLGAANAWFLAGAALLSALLQGSAYHFCSVAYRRAARGPVMSRLDEREEEPEAPSTFLRFLKAFYLAVYGWQDRLVQAAFRAASGPLVPREPAIAPGIARDPILSRSHLTGISCFGLGSQLLLVSAALGLAALTGGSGPLVAYLVLLATGNVLLLGDLAWIRAWRALRTRAARRAPMR